MAALIILALILLASWSYRKDLNPFTALLGLFGLSLVSLCVLSAFGVTF